MLSRYHLALTSSSIARPFWRRKLRSRPRRNRCQLHQSRGIGRGRLLRVQVHFVDLGGVLGGMMVRKHECGFWERDFSLKPISYAQFPYCVLMFHNCNDPSLLATSTLLRYVAGWITDVAVNPGSKVIAAVNSISKFCQAILSELIEQRTFGFSVPDVHSVTIFWQSQ